MEIRNRLGDNKNLRKQQELETNVGKAEQRASQHKKRQKDQQLRIRQLEEARRRIQQRSRSEDSKEGSRNDSTLGWLRNRLSSGFQWK